MSRKFPRRIKTESEYRGALATRDSATAELKAFIKDWCPPEKAKDLQLIVHRLIYAHQQTVAWQSEFEVNDEDIEVH